MYAQRLGDPKDPLRTLLEVAREWHVPPTVVLGERTVSTNEWTSRDVDYMVALKVFEQGLCPGGDHVLAETSRPEHAGAYIRGDETECHLCTARGVLAKAADEDQPAGVLTSMMLDPDRVALNRLPAPPLPPELAS